MSKTIYKEIALTGKQITEDDATQIQDNFQTVKNMIYKRNNPKSIRGMTQLNTALTTKLQVRSAYQYEKNNPKAENHVLVQAWNSGSTAFDIRDNESVIPATGDFDATALYTDASADTTGATNARWSAAPNDQIVYCDGTTARIWSGNENKVSKVFNHDPAGTFIYDYTDAMNNDIDVSPHLAPLKGVAGSPT